MKKKQLCVLVGLLIMTSLITGCALRGVAKETEDSQTESVSEIESISEEDSENEVVYKDVYGLEPYRTFEEALDAASHVVLGKCIDKYTEGRYTYVIFEPIETFKGKVEEETVKLKGQNNMIFHGAQDADYYTYRNDLTKYEIGKEYVLITQVDYSKWMKYDYHAILNDICIPKDSIKDSTICGDKSLVKASREQEGIFESYEKLVPYMRDIIAQDTTPFEIPYQDVVMNYIRSYDLKKIVEQTDVILWIKVTSQIVFGGKDGVSVACDATVVEILKGGENAAAEKVVVYVPLDSVIKGEEYIVLVKNTSKTNTGFSISSRRSVYPVTDTETMEKIRELIEQSK